MIIFFRGKAATGKTSASHDLSHLKRLNVITKTMKSLN